MPGWVKDYLDGWEGQGLIAIAMVPDPEDGDLSGSGSRIPIRPASALCGHRFGKCWPLPAGIAAHAVCHAPGTRRTA
jgi:hypothetical protein